MINDKTIRALAPGAWKSEKAHKGAGRFAIRKTSVGSVLFYYRYVGENGHRDSFPLGHYDPKGQNGMTVIQARDRAAELSRLYRTGQKDIRLGNRSRSVNFGFKNNDPGLQVQVSVGNSAETKSIQTISSKENTFSDVLDNYVNYLVARKAESAENVRKNFERYLKKPFPELCDQQATTVTTNDLLPPLAVLIDEGKGPSALMLRTQMYSAFARAISAENDPRIKDRQIIFGLSFNPVSKIPAMSEYKNAGERALSENELAHYVHELKFLPDSAGKDALLTSLSLGGQRLMQLLRATSTNINIEGQLVTDTNNIKLLIPTITLMDGKGRRKKPRKHVLPIVGCAIAILSRLSKVDSSNATIFVGKKGKPITPASASLLVTAISKKLVAEEKIRAPFSYADIRRTCETLFASYSVHKDIRAQIQSHGLSGVQNTHYDRYDYLLQKHEALTIWNKMLDELDDRYVAAKASSQ